jgi:hypothetical protein
MTDEGVADIGGGRHQPGQERIVRSSVVGSAREIPARWGGRREVDGEVHVSSGRIEVPCLHPVPVVERQDGGHTAVAGERRLKYPSCVLPVEPRREGRTDEEGARVRGGVVGGRVRGDHRGSGALARVRPVAWRLCVEPSVWRFLVGGRRVPGSIRGPERVAMRVGSGHRCVDTAVGDVNDIVEREHAAGPPQCDADRGC